MSDNPLSIAAEKLYELKKLRTGRHRRFAKEHMQLHRLAQWSDRIDYKVLGEMVPVATRFEVTYHLRSMIGIDDQQQPIYGDQHVIQIELPANYPQETARCKAVTDLWHPNIKWFGKYKGRICTNSKEFGTLYNIAELVIGIGEILQYRNYHAEQIPPYPEDERVAEWIRDVAEPQGIVSLTEKIVVDDTELKMPPDDWVPPGLVQEIEEPDGPQKLGDWTIKKIREKDEQDDEARGNANIRFRPKK